MFVVYDKTHLNNRNKNKNYVQGHLNLTELRKYLFMYI
jgi:hypothetical protein